MFLATYDLKKKVKVLMFFSAHPVTEKLGTLISIQTVSVHGLAPGNRIIEYKDGILRFYTLNNTNICIMCRIQNQTNNLNAIQFQFKTMNFWRKQFF